MIRITAALAVLCLLFSARPLSAQRAIFVEEEEAPNAFYLGNSQLPQWEIISAGPGRDGIPAIDQPVFADRKRGNVPADPDEPVVGLYAYGEARAYPLSVLTQHEIINDNIGGRAVAVTYSPLCGSAMAYLTENGDADFQLASSGLLYNNNPLFFDRKTESLWSQVMGQAVSGPEAGRQLVQLPATMTTWAEWSNRYPETRLLSSNTGYDRDYDVDTYAGYEESDRLYFPLNHLDRRLPMKEKVLCIAVEGVYRAYAYSALALQPVVEDQLNGRTFTINYLADSQTAFVTDEYGMALPAATMYWFAWSAFHPETDLFRPEQPKATLSMLMGMLD